ncbi:MAG: hypothetical protein JOZ37_18000, partial [Actinobacteria bacterium]|nr:hypothetical protein [Actinomycetota bacterium]
MSAPPLVPSSGVPSTDTWVSPLVEVERSVQERAKAIALDMHDPAGRLRLRELIAEEVRRWD